MATETELHALVVKIDGDLSGLRAELKKGQEDAGGFGKMIGSIFAGGALLEGANKVTEALVEFAKTMSVDSVKAAEESEAAVTRLNTALKITRQYSPEASQALQDLAAELQRTTKYEDDAIISAQGLIQSLGKLSNDGLKQATKAAVDLSAGLGIDLNTAALLVGKAAAGEVSSFSRYGLKIQETGDKAKDFTAALNAINEAFGGSASAQARTFEGSLSMLHNAFNDLQEEIGKVVTENDVVKTTMAEVTEIIRKMSSAISDNKAELTKLVAEGLLVVIDSLVAAGAAMDAVGRIFSASLAVMKGDIKGIGKAFTEDSKLGEATIALAELGKKARASFDQMGSSMSAADGEVWDLRDAVKELSAEAVQAGEAGKKLAEKFGGAGSTEQLDAQMELLKAQREAQLVTIAEYNEREVALENQKLQQQVALVEQAHAQKKISDQAYYNTVVALNTKSKADRAKEAAEVAKAEKQANEQKIAETQGTLGTIAGLMSSNNETLFAIGKAAAIANATISMYEGVMKAWALGPILGPILAPLVFAAGAANIASIASTSPKFAEGGTVPGFGFADNQQITATPGEEIIDRSTSQRFRAFMDKMESGDHMGAAAAKLEVEFSLVGDLGKLVEATIVKNQRLNVSVLKRIS